VLACLPGQRFSSAISVERGKLVKELFPAYFLQAKVEMGGREGRKIFLTLHYPYPCVAHISNSDLSQSSNLNQNILNSARLFILFLKQL